MQRFSSARLVIAGDGPDRLALQQQAATLGIARSVDFRGWVKPEDVSSLINQSTLVLMPSRQDSLPLVALEAALMARPVVATSVGGLPEVVAHEQTGLLVNAEDTQALADAVESLLRRPARARSLGQSARERARETFSWERHVEGYDTLYRELASRASRAQTARTNLSE